MTRHAGDAVAIVRNEGVGVVLADVRPNNFEFEEIVNFIQDIFSQRQQYMENTKEPQESIDLQI